MGIRIANWFLSTVILTLVPVISIVLARYFTDTLTKENLWNSPELLLLALAVIVTGIGDCVEAIESKWIDSSKRDWKSKLPIYNILVFMLGLLVVGIAYGLFVSASLSDLISIRAGQWITISLSLTIPYTILGLLSRILFTPTE